MRSLRPPQAGEMLLLLLLLVAPGVRCWLPVAQWVDLAGHDVEAGFVNHSYGLRLTAQLADPDFSSFCPEDWRCEGSCGRLRPNSTHRICSCDALCQMFGDCCFDFWTACESFYDSTSDHEPTLVDASVNCERHLETNSNYEFLLTVSTCAYRDNPDLVSLCESPANETEVQADPYRYIERIPVTDSLGVTYRNAYCAVCNRVSLHQVGMFDAWFQCFPPPAVERGPRQGSRMGGMSRDVMRPAPVQDSVYPHFLQHLVHDCSLKSHPNSHFTPRYCAVNKYAEPGSYTGLPFQLEEASLDGQLCQSYYLPATVAFRVGDDYSTQERYDVKNPNCVAAHMSQNPELAEATVNGTRALVSVYGRCASAFRYQPSGLYATSEMSINVRVGADGGVQMFRYDADAVNHAYPDLLCSQPQVVEHLGGLIHCPGRGTLAEGGGRMGYLEQVAVLEEYVLLMGPMRLVDGLLLLGCVLVYVGLRAAATHTTAILLHLLLNALWVAVLIAQQVHVVHYRHFRLLPKYQVAESLGWSSVLGSLLALCVEHLVQQPAKYLLSLCVVLAFGGVYHSACYILAPAWPALQPDAYIIFPIWGGSEYGLSAWDVGCLVAASFALHCLRSGRKKASVAAGDGKWSARSDQIIRNSLVHHKVLECFIILSVMVTLAKNAIYFVGVSKLSVIMLSCCYDAYVIILAVVLFIYRRVLADSVAAAARAHPALEEKPTVDTPCPSPGADK